MCTNYIITEVKHIGSLSAAFVWRFAASPPCITALGSQTKVPHTTCISVFMFPWLVAERRRWDRTSLSSFAQRESSNRGQVEGLGACSSLPGKSLAFDLTARWYHRYLPCNYCTICYFAVENIFRCSSLNINPTVNSLCDSVRLHAQTIVGLYVETLLSVSTSALPLKESLPHTNKQSSVHFKSTHSKLVHSI